MQESKRVVLLDHIKSDHIEQAIIILKDNIPSKHASIIKEAEEIVNLYAAGLYGKETLIKISPSKPTEGSILTAIIALAALAGITGLCFWIYSLIF